MRHGSFFLLLVAALLGLAACGFTPLYVASSEKNVAAQQLFESVTIDNIPDREGQVLRNLLMDRFYTQGRPGNPRYRLVLTAPSGSETDLDETTEAEATRRQINVSTTLALTDLRTNTVVLERSLRALASYNVLPSEYTTRVSREATRDAAIEDLARQIETALALFFREHARTP